MLHYEYTQYDQYINYQISSSGRLLSSLSNSDEKIMPDYYLAFYIMAQFGGLYAFLHLLFGIFMNRWTEQNLKQSLISNMKDLTQSKRKLRNLPEDRKYKN